MREERPSLCIVLKKVYQKSVNKMSVISYKQIMRLESGVRGGKQTPSASSPQTLRNKAAAGRILRRRYR